MKPVLTFMLILTVAGSLFAEKVTNLSAAKALAASSNKPLLMDFMTEW